MKTTEYLDAIATKYGASDYKISKLLGVTRQAISDYRNRGRGFDDAVAIKVADLLKTRPEKVLVDMHAERAKDDEVKKVWERMAKRVATVAGAAILTAAGMMAHPQSARAPGASGSNSADFGIYIMRIRRWLSRLLLSLALVPVLASADCLATPVSHPGHLYVDIGLALQAVHADAPEISPKLTNPLGQVEIGYRQPISRRTSVTVYLQHTSSLPYTERGYGLNLLGIKLHHTFR